MAIQNIFNDIPRNIPKELFEPLLKTEQFILERIISKGQSSPAEGWYEQTQNEWVMVLKGNAVIRFDNGKTHDLTTGDYLQIPAMQKHKVVKTCQTEETVWLALHY